MSVYRVVYRCQMCHGLFTKQIGFSTKEIEGVLYDTQLSDHQTATHICTGNLLHPPPPEGPEFTGHGVQVGYAKVES